MDTLRFESDPRKQTALSVGFMVVGGVLLAASRPLDTSGFSNSLAGFLLGILLLVIGLASFLTRGRQTILIDPRNRMIVVEDAHSFRTRKLRIPFSDIADTGIGYLGKESSRTTFYYINLKLRSGGEYPLFSPGRFFEGGSDRSVMESRRQMLEQWIKNQAGHPGPRSA